MWRRWIPMWRRREFESAMAEEMRFHLDRRADDLMALEGVDRVEAMRRARLEFGSSERVREECRESRGLSWFDELGRNLRFGWRVMRSSPLSALTAIVVLALCIGANTAIYSVIDSVFLRPLPFAEPERLGHVVVKWRPDRAGFQENTDGRTWEILRDTVKSVDLTVFKEGASGVNFSDRGRPQFLREQRVSSGFFRVLGVTPAMGREFNLDEDRRGGPPVAIVSASLWRSAFGGAADLIGRTIQLKGEAHTVVGILPDGASSTVAADVFTPIRADQKGEGQGANFRILGRVRPGVNWAQAMAEIESAGAEPRIENPRPGVRPKMKMVPLLEGLGSELKTPLLLLQGCAGLVLLIGCLNVAGLNIARGAGRIREVATRMAIGGGRLAVLRQFLTENVLLALIGGGLGIVLGFGLVKLLRAIVPAGLIWREFSIDWRVLVFAGLTSVVCGVLFGTLPAWHASRIDARSMLAEGARSIAGSSRRWPRRLLVAGEIGLAIAVLSGAVVLMRTFWTMQTLRPGFDTANVLSAQVSLMDKRYESSESVLRLFDGVLAKLRETPGLEGAAAGLTLPFQRPLNLGVKTADGWASVNMTYVTDGYFETLRMPLLRGRGIDRGDSLKTGRVIVVNESFAKKFLPGGDPIGRSVMIANAEREIVGLVGDTAQSGSGLGGGALVPALPGAYMPASQVGEKAFPLFHTWFSPRFVVRSGLERTGVEAAVKAAIAAADPSLPVAKFEDMEELRSAILARQRFLAGLLASMALLGLVLSAVGVYGLVADSVAERRREMGVKLALGARPGLIVLQVLRGVLALAVGGVVAGGLGGVWVNQVLRSSVWGSQGAGNEVVGLVAVVLIGVTLVAGLIPALRVTRINPSQALRLE